jgi:hypothetical protein
MKQHTAHQYLDSLNTHHQALNELLQTLKTASTSMLVTDDEFKNLRNTYENISHAENHTRINYYYEQAEGDLVSMHQRHQETLIEQQIRDAHKQVRDLLGIIRPSTSPQANTVHNNVSHYVSELSENELNTKVLDAHVFYRMIYDKVVSGEYSHQQFKQLFNEISENLGKNPMTVSSIIDFYKKNDIAQPTDEDFRLLIRNEHKNYTNTAVSVRQMHPDDYVKGTLTTEISLQKKAIETDKSTDLLQDADSFYKLIYKKMALREYSAAEFNKLYVHISEKLVHSPLLKNEIIEFYAQQNIKQLTEEEWDTLFNRQETRKLPEHITAQTADLDFQGTVQIVDEHGFKLNTDLYYNTESNDQASHEYLDNLANTLLDTANCFNKFFGIRKLDQANNFRLFIFDSKEHYLTYFPQATGHATASDNGNVCNLYIFKGKNNYSNVSDLLHHEFAHALTFQSTAKLGLSTTLMEGIAEFLVHKMNGKSNVDFINLIPQENYKRSIREIVSNPLNRSDPYLTGAAIVAFLEETNPNFIENLLYAAQEASKNDQHIKVYEMMHNLFDKYEQQSLLEIPWFKQYLSIQQPNEPIHSRLRRASDTSDISAELTLSPPSHIQPSKQTGTPQALAESKIISVDYFQIKELYETVSESEKFSVRSLWDKLHQAEYNLNALQTSLTDAEYQHLDFLQSMARAQPISEDVIAVAITAGYATSNSDLSQQTIQPDKLVETMAAMTSTDQTSAYSDRGMNASFHNVTDITQNVGLSVEQKRPELP